MEKIGSLFTPGDSSGKAVNPYEDDKKILEYVRTCKQEALEQRWVYERAWWRCLLYLLGRQWIFYDKKRGQWVDKRIAQWVPRPTNTHLRDGLKSIRAMFGAQELATYARPLANDAKCMATAETADRMEPLLKQEHDMPRVLHEARFWFIATGNVFLHPWWNNDKVLRFVQFQQCPNPDCGEAFDPEQLALAGPQGMCPACGRAKVNDFTPAVDALDQPFGETASDGGGETDCCSPFEIAAPPDYTRSEDLPFLIRLRWRPKRFCEDTYDPAVLKGINWEKMPHERSLQLVRSMATQSDIGTTKLEYGASDAANSEGISEYELWSKPTKDFQHGLVARVLGDSSPRLVKDGAQGLPGMLPYRDRQGHPYIPFYHAGYDDIGGRLWAASAFDHVIQKLDQLNQSDSMAQMAEQRMSNPVWLKPAGSAVKSFTGQPGLVVEYNPLAGGQAKPERIPGQNIPASIFTRRAQLVEDIESALGTRDVLKGQKPAGVTAFAAMNLLVERAQSVFGPALQSFGRMYRGCYQAQLELERQFGPDTRTLAVMKPNRQWTWQEFQKADLNGAIEIVIEDGSSMPKTALGERATIEHLRQLGFVNPGNAEQQYAIMKKFGAMYLLPSLDDQVNAALREQDAFVQLCHMWGKRPLVEIQEPVTPEPPPPPPAEAGAEDGKKPQEPAAPGAAPAAGAAPPEPPPTIMVPKQVLPGNPLVRKAWDQDQIHLAEHKRWANSDEAQTLFKANPSFEQLLVVHLQEHEQGLMMEAMKQMMLGGGPGAGAPGAPPQQKPGGAGMAMQNSNRNAGDGGTNPPKQ